MCNATQGNLGGSRRIGHRQICPWNLFCDKLGSGIFFATNWAPESFFAKNWATESFLRQIEPAIFIATNCTPEYFLQIGPRENWATAKRALAHWAPANHWFKDVKNYIPKCSILNRNVQIHL